MADNDLKRLLRTLVAPQDRERELGGAGAVIDALREIMGRET